VPPPRSPKLAIRRRQVLIGLSGFLVASSCSTRQSTPTSPSPVDVASDSVTRIDVTIDTSATTPYIPILGGKALPFLLPLTVVANHDVIVQEVLLDANLSPPVTVTLTGHLETGSFDASTGQSRYLLVTHTATNYAVGASYSIRLRTDFGDRQTARFTFYEGDFGPAVRPLTSDAIGSLIYQYFSLPQTVVGPDRARSVAIELAGRLPGIRRVKLTPDGWITVYPNVGQHYVVDTSGTH